MPSAAGLFLALHGSHPSINSIFSLISSLFLLGPLIATGLEFTGLSKSIYPLLPSLSTLQRVLFLFVVACLNTRIWTSRGQTIKSNGGARRVPTAPYWIPRIGNLLEIIFFRDGFLKRVRDSSDEGIFALNLGGVRHHFVRDPSLLADFKRKHDEGIATEPLVPIAVSNAFSIQKRWSRDFDAMYRDMRTSLSQHLRDQKHLDEMMKLMADNFRENLPDVVSFNPSVVDQMPWERVSGVVVSDLANGKQEVEADLLPLVQSFLGLNTLPTFTGSALLESYPEIFTDLSVLNSSFFILALGFPRWYPVPGLVPAHVARNRLLAKVASFNKALDISSAGKEPGSTYRDLSDVGEAYLTLQSTLRDFPLDARTGLSAYAIWIFFSNPTLLAFWMLLRVLNSQHDSPDFIAELRKEITPYTRVTQAPPTLSMSEPPRLSLDVNGLLKSCPRLKACFIETVRLDTHSAAFMKLQKDISLASSAAESSTSPSSNKGASYELRKDEYLDVTPFLHNSDPKSFESPQLFLPSRHIAGDVGSLSARWGSVAPYGVSELECGISEWTERLCLAFVSSLLVLWDFEPAGKEWKIPKKKQEVAVDVPNGAVRVKLRRRHQ